MSYRLLIVESPAKAKTIGRYLGKQYKIAASVGHIRDLPASTLGVNVRDGFKPRYVNMRGKEKVIRELKKLSEEADDILIATDPDREGEAIGWHLTKLLNLDEKTDCRVRFNEITERAVREAVEHPKQIDMDLVNAQQARRILDRLVGYELSPLLWEKVQSGTSAGRVQSAAARLIVEREREIRAFRPEEYWSVHVFLKNREGKIFRVNYHGEKKGGKLRSVKLSSEAEVRELLDRIGKEEFLVSEIRRGEKKRRPYAPFTTSTLQQEAAKRLSFSSKRTMAVAQQLYEGVDLKGLGQTALVTYIRTDSVRISASALEAARTHIAERFGDAYVPAKPRFYSNKKQSQDAHEAIRPSHFDLPPWKLGNALSPEQLRLYSLIWNRFMASQMSDALADTVSVDIAAGSAIFRASGEQIRFPGFLAAYGDPVRKEEEVREDGDEEEKTKVGEDHVSEIPLIEEGESLLPQKIDPQQKFTSPPPRYSEAALIREMEKLGIGRPSTYAPTIVTIVERAKYAEREQRSLRPTKLGEMVTILLEENFPDIVDSSFTAKMEDWLDEVETGAVDWVKILEDFYPSFHEQVTAARESVEKVEKKPEYIGEKCPECGAELVKREGRYGAFIACSGFPQCRYKKAIEERPQAHCPLCGSELLRLRSRKRGAEFYVCAKEGSDKNCSFISWDLPIDGKHCPSCGSYMVLHKFRNRVYERCSNKDCETLKRGKKKERETSEAETEKKAKSRAASRSAAETTSGADHSPKKRGARRNNESATEAADMEVKVKKTRNAGRADGDAKKSKKKRGAEDA